MIFTPLKRKYNKHISNNKNPFAYNCKRVLIFIKYEYRDRDSQLAFISNRKLNIFMVKLTLENQNKIQSLLINLNINNDMWISVHYKYKKEEKRKL